MVSILASLALRIASYSVRPLSVKALTTVFQLYPFSLNKASWSYIENYPKLNESSPVTFEELENSLLAKKRDSIDVFFNDTSRDNNLVCQMFEFSQDGVEKLSIIDGGEFDDGDPISPGKQVYHVGKLIKDTSGSETFFNIFTVVFD